MAGEKKKFLLKLLGPQEDLSWYENVAIEAIASRSLVEIRAIPPKPCDYLPVAESTRYKLETDECSDEDAARSIYNQGLADLESGMELEAADFNNLACAAMWMKSQATSKSISYASDWFKKADNKKTPGYDKLSDSSKKTVKNNFTLTQKPPEKPDLPLIRVLPRKAFDQLAKKYGLMEKRIEGFSIRMEEGGDE